MNLFVLVVLMCTGTSLDDCHPGHIPELFVDREPCAGTLAKLERDGAEHGVQVLGYCAHVELPKGQDS